MSAKRNTTAQDRICRMATNLRDAGVTMSFKTVHEDQPAGSSVPFITKVILEWSRERDGMTIETGHISVMTNPYTGNFRFMGGTVERFGMTTNIKTWADAQIAVGNAIEAVAKVSEQDRQDLMCWGCDTISTVVVADGMWTCPECKAEQPVCLDCPMVGGEHSYGCMSNWK